MNMSYESIFTAVYQITKYHSCLLERWWYIEKYLLGMGTTVQRTFAFNYILLNGLIEALMKKTTFLPYADFHKAILVFFIKNLYCT